MAYIRNEKEDKRIRERMRQILMEEIYGSDLHMSMMQGGEPPKKRKPRPSKKMRDKFRRMEKKEKSKKEELLKKRFREYVRKTLAEGKIREKMKKEEKNKKPIKKQRKPNPWITFYRNWKKEHPENTGKVGIKCAAIDYKIHKQKQMKKGSALIYESDYFSDYDEYD